MNNKIVHKVTCPRCSKKFNPKKQMKYRVRLDKDFIKILLNEFLLPWNSGVESLHGADITVCPSCKKEFKYADFNHFGALSNRKLQVVFVVVLLLFIICPLVVVLLKIIW